MIKFSVKKPFYVFVAVIIVLVIGAVSLVKMPIDLMPGLSINYLLVITTEVGASPQQVEIDIVKPVENTLGTINGVKQVTSTASENYGLVTLEFTDGTDMDGALVRVSSALDSLELPEGCSKPSIMEISLDMMASMYAAVDYEGKDIEEISQFTEDVVIPYLSRQTGVASVTATGEIQNNVEIRLNQDKIDLINDKILALTNDKLDDAKKEITKGKNEIAKGKAELEKGKKELTDKQNETNDMIAEGQNMLGTALATQAAYQANYTAMQAQKTALEAEKKGYTEGYPQANAGLAAIESAFEKTPSAEDPLPGFNLMVAGLAASPYPHQVQDYVALDFPGDVDTAYGLGKAEYEQRVSTALADIDALLNDPMIGAMLDDTAKAGLTQLKAGFGALTWDNIELLYNGYHTRLDQIEVELGNLGTEIMVAKTTVDMINSQMDGLSDTYTTTIAGGLTAAAGFGAGQAQMASAESALNEAQAKIDDAMKTYEDARETAIENANINALLKLDTLSKLIYAQNFSMPAGYIDDEDDNQWLLEVGESFEDVDDIEDLVLTEINDIGEIRIKDIADIVVINNKGETYSKMNGNDAVLLSIFKAGTASTYAVTNQLEKACEELGEKYPGLSVTPIMNQGDYISMIIKSVLSSILLGAGLAILVLALFLKAVKPTLVVAFSIPFSVFFSLIVMYFTGIGINVMSLGGLTIAIGMLVDNSIVVMENIYRMVGKGVPAPRAAVQGAKQVMGSIIASTVTTICVFLPMVYTTGYIAEILMPFAFTISYALIASLIVALTIVPTMSSVLLKNAQMKPQPFFDRVKVVYGKVLEFCLKFKIVPLGISIALLVICVSRAFTTGLVLLDDMESNQISVSVTMPEDIDKETAFATADELTEAILSVDGIAKVGVMSGGTSAITGIGGGSNQNAFKNMNFNILTDDDIKTTDEFNEIIHNIEDATADIDCEVSVSSSALGELSQMSGGSGVSVRLYGDDTDKLIEMSGEIAKMLEGIEGIDEIDQGLSEDTQKLHLSIDKNKAGADGLTVATIYMEIAGKLSTEQTAFTMNLDGETVNVDLINENNPLTYENLLDLELSVTKMNEDNQQETVKKKLSDYATIEKKPNVESIRRIDSRTYMSVSATVEEGYNATLVSRDVQAALDEYKAPDGYTAEISGEYETVMDMIKQMLAAIALGGLLIYLVMVAQFQSLLSPFIIIFTVPLAFTGGMLGLIVTGKNISALSLFGFMILMGTVVNNGIVYVDYVNQLRMKGVEKRVAIIESGKTRMRPILMTALTTILSMSVMVFSRDAGNAMQKPMAIVVAAGLVYSTLMTLIIVPVLYDILYRKQPKEIDVGDDIDDIVDEATELIEQMHLETSK